LVAVWEHLVQVQVNIGLLAAVVQVVEVDLVVLVVEEMLVDLQEIQLL
jgi:hypothetical protein